jgi:hypothetical protein
MEVTINISGPMPENLFIEIITIVILLKLELYSNQPQILHLVYTSFLDQQDNLFFTKQSKKLFALQMGPMS